MEIFGLGIVALFMFLGSFIGRVLAMLVGVSGDVGGVGFSMLFLILFCNYLEKKGKALSAATNKGIGFLSALYIPVVVAMSSNQNVVSAFSGGAVAILAGVLATVLGLLLVPVISGLGKKDGGK